MALLVRMPQNKNQFLVIPLVTHLFKIEWIDWMNYFKKHVKYLLDCKDESVVDPALKMSTLLQSP